MRCVAPGQSAYRVRRVDPRLHVQRGFPCQIPCQISAAPAPRIFFAQPPPSADGRPSRGPEGLLSSISTVFMAQRSPMSPPDEANTRNRDRAVPARSVTTQTGALRRTTRTRLRMPLLSSPIAELALPRLLCRITTRKFPHTDASAMRDTARAERASRCAGPRDARLRVVARALQAVSCDLGTGQECTSRTAGTAATNVESRRCVKALTDTCTEVCADVCTRSGSRRLTLAGTGSLHWISARHGAQPTGSCLCCLGRCPSRPPNRARYRHRYRPGQVPIRATQVPPQPAFGGSETSPTHTDHPYNNTSGMSPRRSVRPTHAGHKAPTAQS